MVFTVEHDDNIKTLEIISNNQLFSTNIIIENFSDELDELNADTPMLTAFFIKDLDYDITITSADSRVWAQTLLINKAVLSGNFICPDQWSNKTINIITKLRDSFASMVNLFSVSDVKCTWK